MNAFSLRDRLIQDYRSYIEGFIQIRDSRIQEFVQKQLDSGLLWPEPLVQLSPYFKRGGSVDELVAKGLLHAECSKIFRRKADARDSVGAELVFHQHQVEAIEKARAGRNYVVTTGTASGKSLTYIVPIVDAILRDPRPGSIKALIVYPMNALANSQMGELEKFIDYGYPNAKGKISYQIYTGPTDEDARKKLQDNPPDILITNYVMAELILTRQTDKPVVRAAEGLKFLVLDELHTYRGRQGADVALLMRRLREAFKSPNTQFVGTSATMSSTGSLEEQRKTVSEVASKLFGAPVAKDDVIVETLEPVTEIAKAEEAGFPSVLTQRLTADVTPPTTASAYKQDPLSIWLEAKLGLEKKADRFQRTRPKTLVGKEGSAADLLAKSTGIEPGRCADKIKEHLLAAAKITDWGEKRPFAFKLHQFVSRGDTVYATVEPESTRLFTARGQRFHPDAKDKALLPFAFCRECGQEYYVVYQVAEDGVVRYEPRNLSDRKHDDDKGTPGLLYLSSDQPWPLAASQAIDRLPENWVETVKSGERVIARYRDRVPNPVKVNPAAEVADAGTSAAFVPSPFAFCLRCGVHYKGRGSDFARLSTLATEGRSTATTIMNFSVLSAVRDPQHGLRTEAQKTLSFMDNRQDASLQAGHFNDFVQVGLLRAALYKAVSEAGAAGLKGQDLIEKTFEALALDPAEYAINTTETRFGVLEEAQGAFKSVLAYRLYCDLERGWRITAPNLERCGLLVIEYGRLKELCQAQDVWQGAQTALANATPEIREKVCKALLDHLRRELAIKVQYLDRSYHQSIWDASYQHLTGPWSLDEDEPRREAPLAIPRAKNEDDWGGFVPVSERGAFASYLKRSTTFPTYGNKLSSADSHLIITDLFLALVQGGILEAVPGARPNAEPLGYRIKADRLIWKAGDGKASFSDPIRVPQKSEEEAAPNPFFVRFYKAMAFEGRGMLAREHTAQVGAREREDREGDFRKGKIKALFCSPTMELGIDIAQLNLVNLRNVPPTPANYAQRSGRAGRQGDAALVYGYCSTYSSHDQFYFRRQGDMVAGVVVAPRIDLSNEELIRSHIHSLFLTVSGVKLEASLTEVLDLSGEPDKPRLKEALRADFTKPEHKVRLKEAAERLLETIKGDLENGRAPWYTPDWLDRVINNLERDFMSACERWWDLFKAAKKQLDYQSKKAADHTLTADERTRAIRRRAEAQAQYDLLLDTGRVMEADFYSYRYFAAEGFLPGFNFPRLPISAYLPGRRQAKAKDNFFSRPRFMAISEFGPRAILYHDGSRYRIEKVMLPLRSAEEDLPTTTAKRCGTCGYFHPADNGVAKDLCERCGADLDSTFTDLFRMQNVSTVRADRINSDEEERAKLGYEVQAAVRFSETPGSVLNGSLVSDGEKVASLTYGQSATIYRMNLGERRRQNQEQLGFLMDLETGKWKKSSDEEEEDNTQDQLRRPKRVVPFVEDRRNCIIIEPAGANDLSVMASLQAALKSAIQRVFQLEDNELAAEVLPDIDERRSILFYEASEGGAGVLKRLVEDPELWPQVLEEALKLCHFDNTGKDLERAEGASEDCVAACYDCLLSYYNQFDHRHLDRHRIKDLLLVLRDAILDASPSNRDRVEHLQALLRGAGSGLEERWLKFLAAHKLRLPDEGQVLVDQCRTRPDFSYKHHSTVIYVDGPPHDFPERQLRDQQQTACMEDQGYTVIRFGHDDDWMARVARYPEIFGRSA